ncbi:hypothetical protein [Ochrobactrum sp. SFR4]|uniref:hypothetical protein n=1 Tax=Ochrobactrum sp. SFR4 TaxID=2717368 RepID=UPI001C8CEE6D|nr:hypothetical protein [Ochrobactrum sp. SFR4]MBX8827444.1 hypothetical protein [Ochrobactrum sp. SFR4]
MNRPLIRPYKAPNGSYILHPAFVRGLIGQISLQNYNNETREFDWETTREEIQLALQAFEELALTDAQLRGESAEIANAQANGIYECFVASTVDIQ